MTDRSKLNQPEVKPAMPGKEPLGEGDLNRLFAAVKPDPDAGELPDAAPGFMAQALAGALKVQAELPPGRSAVTPVNLWRQLCDAVGGWPAFGAMAAATCAGVWIGIAPPELVSGWPELALSGFGDGLQDGADSFDVTGFSTGIDLFLEEG